MLLDDELLDDELLDNELDPLPPPSPPPPPPPPPGIVLEAESCFAFLDEFTLNNTCEFTRFLTTGFLLE